MINFTDQRFNLNKKLFIGTIAGVLVSCIVFILVFTILYQQQLYAEREKTVNDINGLFHILLKKTMLNNQKDQLNNTISQVVAQNTNLNSIGVLSKEGRIAFSNRLELIGSTIEQNPQDTSVPYNIITKPNDVEILRKITTIYTEKACAKCHKPFEQEPVRGYIMVDYDISNISDKIFKTSLLLSGSGAIIVLINIIGGLWFIRNFILTPVKKISTASKALAAGKLDTRVRLEGNDELTDLADSFNIMGNSLERKITQLDESKTFLQDLVDTSPDAICILNQQFDIILSNKVYKEKRSTKNNSKCYVANFNKTEPCIPTLITCPVVEIIKNNKRLRTIQQHQDLDGNYYYVEIVATPMHVVKDGVKETLIIESIRDFNDKIKYSHETRLAEFGMLAYGVAHEILNPLSSIKFALHSCMKTKDNTNNINMKDILKNIQIIDNEVGACIEVTDRMLKLSSKSSSKHELISITDAVLDTLSLLKWEAKDKNIKIVQRVDNKFKHLMILGSDSDLRVVTLNLAQNAFHAMPNGGKLTIEIRQVDNHVEIIFSDTGVGIKPEDIKKIFYPFFSVRADYSKGTGLGLAICKSIITSYHGTLTVKSSLENGSHFTIQLPIRTEDKDQYP